MPLATAEAAYYTIVQER